jgi:hypothetical protein
MSGFPDDVLATVWHVKLSDDDLRANLPVKVRDERAGTHDVRLLTKLTSIQDRRRQLPTLDDPARGIGQWHDVDRVAVITDDLTFRNVVQFFGLFFHNPIRVFGNAESEHARRWLKGIETS